MAARINDVCDAVVSAITAYWSGLTGAAQMGPADSVSRAYEPDFNQQPQEAGPRPAGRAVFVFPDVSAHDGMNDRGEDLDDHAIAVAVVEWYQDSGVPPQGWVDTRMLFLDSLWRLLRNARADPPVIDTGTWPQSAAVTEWYDPDALRTDRAYFGTLVVTYREVTANITAP